jgi:glycerol uptake facilitator-like aquaporin
VAAQLLGGGAAYWLYTYFIGQTWNNTSGKFEAKIMIAEAVGAFIFSIAWAAAAYQRLEAGKAAAAVGIGLMLGVVIASSASFGLLNPAVALGVRSFSWAYVLGPVLGAIIGFNIYGFLFAPYTKSDTADKKKK